MFNALIPLCLVLSCASPPTLRRSVGICYPRKASLMPPTNFTYPLSCASIVPYAWLQRASQTGGWGFVFILVAVSLGSSFSLPISFLENGVFFIPALAHQAQVPSEHLFMHETWNELEFACTYDAGDFPHFMEHGILQFLPFITCKSDIKAPSKKILSQKVKK